MNIKAKLIRECVKSICWKNSHDATLIPIEDIDSATLDTLIGLITSLDRPNDAVLPRQSPFTKQQWLYMLQLEKHHRHNSAPLSDEAIDELYHLFINPPSSKELIKSLDSINKHPKAVKLNDRVSNKPPHKFTPWSRLSKELAEAREILCKFPYTNGLGVVRRIEQLDDPALYQLSQRCKMRAPRYNDVVDNHPFTEGEWYLIAELERVVRAKYPNRKRLRNVTEKIPELLKKYGLKEDTSTERQQPTNIVDIKSKQQAPKERDDQDYYVYRVEQNGDNNIKSYAQVDGELVHFHNSDPTFLSKEAASSLAAFYNNLKSKESVEYGYATDRFIITYNDRYVDYNQHPATLGISLTLSQKRATSFRTREEADNVIAALSLVFPCITSDNCKTLEVSNIPDIREAS